MHIIIHRLIKLTILLTLMTMISYLMTKYLVSMNNKKTVKRSIKNSIVLDGTITSESYKKFIRFYRKLNKNRDIHLILHTTGGTASIAYAIGNCILNHTGTGKITCYIPYFAMSAGTIIALCCNHIITNNHSLFSSCDNQMPINKTINHVPSSTIINIITHKKNKNEPIKEDWLAAEIEAHKLESYEKKFIKKLCDIRNYDENIIHDELFSGKHHHNLTFTPNEINDMNFGLKITINNNTCF